MKFMFGNMLEAIEPGPVYLVTTNSYIRKDGALVMGRGAARQLAGMFPKLPYALGERIEHLGEYNVGVLTDTATGLSLGAFQVKFNFADEADLDLIKRSVAELTQVATERSDRTFHLNYPGIGNGKLSIDDVEHLLEPLPDNVMVWRFR